MHKIKKTHTGGSCLMLLLGPRKNRISQKSHLFYVRTNKINTGGPPLVRSLLVRFPLVRILLP